MRKSIDFLRSQILNPHFLDLPREISNSCIFEHNRGYFFSLRRSKFVFFVNQNSKKIWKFQRFPNFTPYCPRPHPSQPIRNHLLVEDFIQVLIRWKIKKKKQKNMIVTFLSFSLLASLAHLLNFYIFLSLKFEMEHCVAGNWDATSERLADNIKGKTGNIPVVSL